MYTYTNTYIILMANIYIKPLSFDNIKNEILQTEYTIECKIQVSKTSKKKGLTPIEFLNQKITDKLLIAHKSKYANANSMNMGKPNKIKPNVSKPGAHTDIIPSVCAYFDYIETEDINTKIYLINIRNTNTNTNTDADTNTNTDANADVNVYTDLYYKSHIPNKNKITIVDGCGGCDDKNNIVNSTNLKVISQHKKYLRIVGDVVAVCIDINTYYLT